MRRPVYRTLISDAYTSTRNVAAVNFATISNATNTPFFATRFAHRSVQGVVFLNRLQIVSASKDGTVRLWNLKSKGNLTLWEQKPNRGGITIHNEGGIVAGCVNGDFVVTAGRQDKVRANKWCRQ